MTEQTRQRREQLVQATARDGDLNRHYTFRHRPVSPRCWCGEHHRASVHRAAGGRTYAQACRARGG
jgi:hypothetical protein